MKALARQVASPSRVLVVEDDSAIRQTLAELLEEEGFAVTCAANGAEALDRLAEVVPSVIVLDLMMPVMDGWSFRSLQRRDPRLARIPVVVVSAGLRRDDRSIDALDADAFLPKPFDLDRFVDTIHRFC